jgi:hypothetical protein
VLPQPLQWQQLAEMFRRANGARASDWGSKAAATCSSSTAIKARKPLLQKAPVKASSQKGSASYAGSSGRATASTNITSSALAVPAAIAASPWRSSSDREPFHPPPSGPGLGGDTGTRRQLDPLPQLAAEAEGSSGTEQRQGAGGG